MKSHVNIYREDQYAWLFALVILVVQLLLATLFIFQIGTSPISLPGFLGIAGVTASMGALFYCMRTTISNRTLTVSFGVGLFRKEIDLAKVKSVESAKNPWIYGWGVRLIPGGWLYNLNGSDAVEIRFIDSKRIVRIGTEDTRKLMEEINARIN